MLPFNKINLIAIKPDRPSRLCIKIYIHSIFHVNKTKLIATQKILHAETSGRNQEEPGADYKKRHSFRDLFLPAHSKPWKET